MSRDLPPRGGRQSGGFGQGRSREYSSWSRGGNESKYGSSPIGGAGGGGGGRSKVDPEDQGNLPEELISISRALAGLLRHNKDVMIDNDGWVLLADVMKMREMIGTTRMDIGVIVKESFSKSMPRFQLEKRDADTYIRAAHKRSAGGWDKKDFNQNSYNYNNEKWEETTPPSSRWSHLKVLQDFDALPDGPQTPPPPMPGYGIAPVHLDLDPKPTEKPPKLAGSPGSRSGSSQAGSCSPPDNTTEAQDPWVNGLKFDPWGARARTRDPKNKEEKAKLTKVRFEHTVSSPGAKEPCLLDMDFPTCDTTARSPMDFFIGDGEDEDSSTAEAAAADFDIMSIKLEEDKVSEAAVSKAKGVSNINGRLWVQYEHEDSTKGTWWWCEEIQESLLECTPGAWTQYEEPQSGSSFWCNAVTNEFFYSQ